MGPEVANEADTGSTDSVAVRARVVRWNGWSWVVGSGCGMVFPPHPLFLFLLSVLSFEMLRSLPQTLSPSGVVQGNGLP